MDRSDDPQFGKKFYRDGRRAFEKGRGILSNPWPFKSFAYKSWNAGWNDRDLENRAEADEHRT